MLQRCGQCGTYNFFPKPWCIECGSRDLPWVDAKPSGTIYSFTVSRVVAMNYPAWERELPVVVALLNLDDGPRMYAQVIGCAPESIFIGQRVVACFEPLGSGLVIPKFRPQTDESSSAPAGQR